MNLKQGDLIWMECMPGGLCIFLGLAKWHQGTGKYYKIYHATEGMKKMPDYYFISLDEARELRYYINRE